MNQEGVHESVHYLSSQEATRSITANPYWPKWNSPWWHMATLFEMGQAHQIPKKTVESLVQAIHRQYPQDGRPASTTPCPCQVGNIFQILNATGLDVALL